MWILYIRCEITSVTGDQSALSLGLWEPDLDPFPPRASISSTSGPCIRIFLFQCNLSIHRLQSWRHGSQFAVNKLPGQLRSVLTSSRFFLLMSIEPQSSLNIRANWPSDFSFFNYRKASATFAACFSNSFLFLMSWVLRLLLLAIQKVERNGLKVRTYNLPGTIFCSRNRVTRDQNHHLRLSCTGTSTGNFHCALEDENSKNRKIPIWARPHRKLKK